jgi:hypothetical protein
MTLYVDFKGRKLNGRFARVGDNLFVGTSDAELAKEAGVTPASLKTLPDTDVDGGIFLLHRAGLEGLAMMGGYSEMFGPRNEGARQISGQILMELSPELDVVVQPSHLGRNPERE